MIIREYHSIRWSPSHGVYVMTLVPDLRAEQDAKTTPPLSILLDSTNHLDARNTRVASCNQAPPHLAHSILALIPRPAQRRQLHREHSGGDKPQDHLAQAQKQGPPSHALSAPPVIVP